MRYVGAGAVAAGFIWGQSITGSGTIQGTVKDSGGGAIPKAQAAVTPLETGEVTRNQTNAAGSFATPPLQIGKYKVRVSVPGMKNWESTLELETGRTADIEPVLTPGQVSDTVTVTATIPLVTTTDPTDATMLDARRIKELPINGRDLNTLLALVSPGVEQVIDVNDGAWDHSRNSVS